MAVFLCLLLTLAAIVDGDYIGDCRNEFERWQAKYSKGYATRDDYYSHFMSFCANHRFITEYNHQHPQSVKLELNQFADLSFNDFSRLYLTDPQKCSATIGNHRHSGRSLPKSIDWRNNGVITPVKNQEECGSCWTFSTTGCLEAHHAIATHQLISLSEQQLVDCAGNFNNNGCGGGLPSQAFEYIMYNGGIERESDYPYKGRDGKCRYNSSMVAATVKDVVNITQGSEDEMMDAVANHGPVSIAFDVNFLFQFYSHGIYKGWLCNKGEKHVNHAVLVVGYNVTRSGEEYWIVKNSWGSDWGMDGYFWIEKGTNACGLADCVSYPIV
jgi:cathepsin H